MTFEIDIERQVLQPGDELLGWVTAQDPDIQEIKVIFAGEEVLGANDVARCSILTVVEESIILQTGSDALQRQEFRFIVPPEAPPSFATRDIRCQYVLKAVAKRGLWKRNLLRRLQITLLPLTSNDLKPLPLEIDMRHPELAVLTRLDQTIVLTGDALTGTVIIERKNLDIPMPHRISLRLAAILESIDPYFSHREVLMLNTKEIELKASDDLIFFDNFELEIPTTAEPSGSWNTFRVHYGFRISIYDHQGKDYRSSALIRVMRDIQESRHVSKGLE